MEQELQCLQRARKLRLGRQELAAAFRHLGRICEVQRLRAGARCAQLKRFTCRACLPQLHPELRAEVKSFVQLETSELPAQRLMALVRLRAVRKRGGG